MELHTQHPRALGVHGLTSSPTNISEETMTQFSVPNTITSLIWIWIWPLFPPPPFGQFWITTGGTKCSRSGPSLSLQENLGQSSQIAPINSPHPKVNTSTVWWCLTCFCSGISQAKDTRRSSKQKSTIYSASQILRLELNSSGPQPCSLNK